MSSQQDFLLEEQLRSRSREGGDLPSRLEELLREQRKLQARDAQERALALAQADSVVAYHDLLQAGYAIVRTGPPGRWVLVSG